MANYTDHYRIKFDADTIAAKKQIQGLYDDLVKIGNTSITSNTFNGTTEEIKRAIKAADELAYHLKKSTNVDTGKINLTKFTQSLNNSGKSLKQLQAEMSAIGPQGTKAFNTLARSIVTAEKPLFNFSKTMQNLGQTFLNSVKWTIASSAINGLVGAAQKATGHVKALNKSLNDIRIVTSQSTEQMDKFAKKANQVAKELKTTTTAYTDAALIFYQQGLDDSAVEERTKTVMKMSNVTGEAAADVSSYMTAIWNNFADGSKELEYYADVMTALGAATASSTDEIAAGLDKFAAISNTVGLSYEYATSALATVVSETRQSADIVGTAFKTIFSRLEGLQLGETLDDGTSLNKYSAALASVGVNIKDQSGQLKSMDLILDELGDKWQNLSRDQQVALAQTVAGTRQYTQLISLMENYDTFQKNVRLASGSEGSLNEQAEIYAESWEAARKNVTASAESIYKALLNDDLFIDLNNGFAKVLDSVDRVIEGMGGLKGILPMISSLMLTAFGPQISSYVNNIALSIKDIGIMAGNAFRSTGEKKLTSVEQNRQDAANMVAQSMNSAWNAGVGTEVRSSYIAELSEKYPQILEHAKELTGIEKELYEKQLQRLDATNQEIETQGKLVTLKESQFNAATRLLGKEDLSNSGVILTTNSRAIANDAANALGQEYPVSSIGIGKDVQAEVVRQYSEKLKQQALQKRFLEPLNLDAFELPKESEDISTTMQNFEAHINQNLKKIQELKEALKTLGLSAEQAFGEDAAEALEEYEKRLADAKKNTQKFKQEVESTGSKASGKNKHSNEARAYDDAKRNARLGLRGSKNKEGNIVDAGEIANLNQAFETLKINTENTEQTIQRTKTALLEMGYSEEQLGALEIKAEELGIDFSKLLQLIKDGKIALEGFGQVKPPSFGDYFTAITSGLASVATAIRTVQSIGGIWRNEDLELGEKLLSTMTALPGIMMAVASATRVVNLAEKGLEVTSKALAAAKQKETAQTGLLTAATWANASAQAVLNAIKKYGVVIGLAVGAAAIATIAVMTATTAAINGETNALKKRAKAEQEASDAAQKSANETEEAYENLKEALESYNEALEKTKELTTNTEEWNEAIKDVNKQARELLDTYENLSAYMKDGIIYIDSESQERAIVQAEEEAIATSITASVLGQQAKRTTLQAELGKNFDKAIKSSYFVQEEKEAIAQILYELQQSNPQANKQDFSKLLKESNIEELGYYTSDDFNILVNVLWEQKDALIKNTEELKHLEDSNRLLSQENAKKALGDEYKDVKNADAIHAMVGQRMENYIANKSEDMDLEDSDYEDYVSKIFGIDDVKRVGRTDNAGRTKIVYYDEEGKKQTKWVAKSSVQQYVAEQEASKETDTWAAEEKEWLESIKQNFSLDVNGSALVEALGYGTAAFMSREDAKQYANLDGVSDKELAEQFGLTDLTDESQKARLEEIKKVIQWASDSVAATDMAWKDASTKVRDAIGDQGEFDEKYDEGQQKSILANTSNIFKQFGEEAAKNYIEALNGIQDNEELQKRLAEMDITSEGTIEQIKALAEEFNLTDEQTNNLISSFDDFQIAAVQTAETIKEVAASLYSSLQKIKTGSTIKDDEFATYEKLFGDEIGKYFVEMADGTKALTMDAETFKQIAQEVFMEQAFKTKGNMDAFMGSNADYYLSEEFVNNFSGGDRYDTNGRLIYRNQDEYDEAIKFLRSSGIGLKDLKTHDDGSFVVDDAFRAKLQQAQELYNQAITSLEGVGLHDSIAELEALRQSGKMTDEGYANNIKYLATQYASAKDELDAYNKAVRLSGKDSNDAKEAQEKLNRAVKQAQYDEAAVAILEAKKNLKDLTFGTEDYNEELQKVAKAINKAFGTGIDTTFVEQNKELLETWASGGEGAKQAGAEIWHLAQSYSGALQNVLSTFNIADKDLTNIIKAWDGMSFTVDGKADVTDLIRALEGVGLTAQQIAAILAAIGNTELTISDIGTISTSELNDETLQRIITKQLTVTGQVPNVDPDMAMVNSILNASSGGGGGEKKKVEDEVERYHETERTLSRLERLTKNLSDAKNEAFGQEKIDLINAERYALEQELKTYQALDDEILKYLAQDKANIAQHGATFDDYGNISNYEELVTNMVNRNIAGEISNEEFDQFQKWLSQYEETLDKWYDNQDSKREKERAIVEKEIEAIDAKVEIKLHLSERELQFIEKQLERLEDQAFSTAEKIDLIASKTEKAMENSKTYQQGIKDLQDQAAENLANGLYEETGGYSDKMRTQMEEYSDGLLEQSSILLESKKEVEEMFGAAIDETSEVLDEQIGRFDSYGAVFENYKNILGLSGKSVKDAALMIDLGNKSVQNSINKLESTRKKQETLQSALDAAEAELLKAQERSDSESVKYWEEEINKITIQVEEGMSDLTATFEETLQAAADNFAAAVEQTVAVFSESMTRFKDLDIASDHYEKQKTLAEQYLDVNTQNYELSKLMRNINAEIDKTDNLAAKVKLRDVLEEINEIQANNAELSQYDLDMLNAKYQLKLAEIALEEAQNAKSQVRLTQTAGGGWGYVYTADQNTIDKAEQNYEDKLYEIQKLSQDRMNELSDNILQNYQEYRDAVGALKIEDFENKEAYMAEVDRLTEYYVERDKYLQNEFNKAVKDSGQTYKDTLLGQTLDAESYQEAHERFVTETNTVTDSLSTHYDTWKTSVSGAYTAAGLDEEKFKNQVVNNAETIINKSNEVKTAVTTAATKSKEFLTGVVDSIGTYQTTYSEEIDEMVDSNDSLYQEILKMFELLSSPPDVEISITTDENKIKSLIEQLEDIPRYIETVHATTYTSSGGDSGNSYLTGDSKVTMIPGGDGHLGRFYVRSNNIETYDGVSYINIGGNEYIRTDDIGKYNATFLGGNSQGSTYEALEQKIPTWIKKTASFDTGGYTGTWGAEGKFAMLHEKEIILNKSDTANLLTSIEIVRSIAQQLDALSQYQRMFNISTMLHWPNNDNQPIEQNVYITAEFPDATDRHELEEAFKTLMNYSSQYINRYNK